MVNSFGSFGGLGETTFEETTPVKKKPGKIASLSLAELYERVSDAGKATPSVRKAIIAKEDFSRVSPSYCRLVCGLRCSSRKPDQARLQHRQYDIVVIQDHDALPDKYKSSEQQEMIYRNIIGFLATKYFQGLSFTVLNALKCLPSPADLSGANVTYSKLSPCTPYLLEELRQIRPKAIIVLTTNASKAIGLGLSSSGNRGQFAQTAFGPAVITLHPKVLTMIRQNASGKDWGPDYLEVIDRDFHKAARLARGDLKIISLDEALDRAAQHIQIARSLDDVRQMLETIQRLPESKIVSFDLETTSLDPWADNAKILTAQFGYLDPETGEAEAVVIPLWHRANVWYNPDEAWPFVAEILLSNRAKVGHNIKFDIIYTYVCTGVRVVNGCLDTLLLLHAINSGLKNNFSLKKGVWDFLPETGLGGYEDKLPALTSAKVLAQVDEEDASESSIDDL